MMNVGQTILSCACRDCIVAVAYGMRAYALLPHMVERMVNLATTKMESRPPAKAQHCNSPDAVGFSMPNRPIQMLPAILERLQHWAGSAGDDGAEKMMEQMETDEAEDDPVNLLA